MDPLFDAFDRANEETEALMPAVRTVLDPASPPAERAAAIAEIRASSSPVEAAVRRVSEDPRDTLTVARAVFDAVLADHVADPAEREQVASTAVEQAALLGEHAVAIAFAERALAAVPGSAALTILLASAHANRGTFEPARLEPLLAADVSTGLRRRLLANLGTSLLAVGRWDDGLRAWHEAAEDATWPMSPDVAVVRGGEPIWIQRMRALLQLDGLGALARSWGIGGPRMVVLLAGLAEATDGVGAETLRAEAIRRLRAGCEGFAFDPAEPDVTLEALLEDAAELARSLGVDEAVVRRP